MYFILFNSLHHRHLLHRTSEVIKHNKNECIWVKCIHNKKGGYKRDSYLHQQQEGLLLLPLLLLLVLLRHLHHHLLHHRLLRLRHLQVLSNIYRLIQPWEDEGKDKLLNADRYKQFLYIHISNEINIFCTYLLNCSCKNRCPCSW